MLVAARPPPSLQGTRGRRRRRRRPRHGDVVGAVVGLFGGYQVGQRVSVLLLLLLRGGVRAVSLVVVLLLLQPRVLSTTGRRDG